MPHQEDGEDWAIKFMRKRMERETMAHLRDIRRVHGDGKRWPSLAIPAGLPRFIERPPMGSCFGSPGALCAADGDRTVWATSSD